MTDKVQKIREEVEMVVNRRLNLLNGDYFDLNKETNGFTNEIMDIIDSLQKEPVSKEIGDYDHKAVMEALHPELKEESVSEDLGDYINELSKQFPEVSFAKLSRIAVRVAKWQKEKDVKKIKTAIDFSFHGGRCQKEEEILKNAIDANCFGLQGDALFSFKLPADKYLVGSKVKVFVIKED